MTFGTIRYAASPRPAAQGCESLIGSRVDGAKRKQTAAVMACAT
jgi:hypothetical protein